MKKYIISILITIFALWQIWQMLMDKSYLETEYTNVNKIISEVNLKISSYKLKYKGVVESRSDRSNIIKYKNLPYKLYFLDIATIFSVWKQSYHLSSYLS